MVVRDMSIESDFRQPIHVVTCLHKHATVSLPFPYVVLCVRLHVQEHCFVYPCRIAAQAKASDTET